MSNFNDPSPTSSMSGSSTSSWYPGTSGTQPIPIPRPTLPSQMMSSGGQYSSPGPFLYETGPPGMSTSNDSRMRSNLNATFYNGSSSSSTPISISPMSGHYVVGTMDLEDVKDQCDAADVPSSPLTRYNQVKHSPTPREDAHDSSAWNGVSSATFHSSSSSGGQYSSQGGAVTVMNAPPSVSLQNDAASADSRLIHGSGFVLPSDTQGLDNMGINAPRSKVRTATGSVKSA
ncbi:hypothetical protein OF83DRAFT_1167191 [Amylostereum chailletii]|nr:hypothetical protein OF83DRAFT_1167191 [Amylostereum chailletii]